MSSLFLDVQIAISDLHHVHVVMGEEVHTFEILDVEGDGSGEVSPVGPVEGGDLQSLEVLRCVWKDSRRITRHSPRMPLDGELVSAREGSVQASKVTYDASSPRPNTSLSPDADIVLNRPRDVGQSSSENLESASAILLEWRISRHKSETNGGVRVTT